MHRTGILASAFPPHERGKAYGINAAAVYVGLSLGPLYGGLLTEYLGWRAIFLVTIPLGLAAFFLLSRIKGDWAEAKDRRFDVKGSVISALAIVALMYGFTRLPDVEGIVLAAAG